MHQLAFCQNAKLSAEDDIIFHQLQLVEDVEIYSIDEAFLKFD